MIITLSSKIKKLLLSIFLATLILLGLFYFALLQGISIPSVHLPGITIEQLYLKLDKKLIVRAKAIRLATKKRPQKLDIAPYFRSIDYIEKNFQSIAIDRLLIGDSPFRVLYRNGVFAMRGDAFFAKLRLRHMDKKVLFHLLQLRYIPLGLELSGSGAVASLRDGLFRGVFSIEGARGSVTLQMRGKNLYFEASSRPFDNATLAKIFAHLDLHKDIKAWSYKKVVAKSYRLVRLKGKITRGEPLRPDAFMALIEAKDAKVYFHPDLPPARIQKIALTYKNDSLFFKLVAPTYEGKDLSGSRVLIRNLTHGRSYIDIFIKTKTPYDADVTRLLAAYGVHIPLRQLSGATDAAVQVRIWLKNNETDIKGRFKVADSLIDLSGVKMQLHRADIELDNDTLLFHPSLVSIDPYVDADVKGFVDLGAKRGKVNIHAKRLEVKFGKSHLLQGSDIKDTLVIDLSKKLFALKNLGVDFYFDRQKRIVARDITRLLPYSEPARTIGVRSGSVTLTIAKKIDLEASLFVPNKIVYKKGHPLTHFALQATIADSTTRFRLNDFAHGTLKPKHLTLYLNDIHLHLPKMEGNGSLPFDLELFGKRLALSYQKRTLLADSLTFHKSADALSLKGRYKKGRFRLDVSRRITLRAKALGDSFVNALVGKAYVQGGSIDVEAEGPKERVHGFVHIKGSYIKDLKALNNLFAFFNTIPALITFSDPGYSTHGLYVQKGDIEFFYSVPKKVLALKKVHIESQSLTIEGYGALDFAHDTIAMKLDLQTLKNVSNIIKNIPIAGYIILGKDGTISTHVALTGPIDDPKVTTNVAKDTLTAPLNIIKRTLMLPFTIFEK